MLEIIYQEGCAPVMGEIRNCRSSEILPVIDENSVVIGQASRGYAHKASLLHPVVHLHIIDRFSRIYLQKRSAGKDSYPGLWDTAVGGHVSFGERLQEALFREAQEELGLTDFNPVPIESHSYQTGTDKETAFIYAAVGCYKLKPDRDEVDEGRWWTPEEIEEKLGSGIFTTQFEEEYRRIKDKLQALL